MYIIMSSFIKKSATIGLEATTCSYCYKDPIIYLIRWGHVTTIHITWLAAKCTLFRPLWSNPFCCYFLCTIHGHLLYHHYPQRNFRNHFSLSAFKAIALFIMDPKFLINWIVGNKFQLMFLKVSCVS